MVKGTDYLIELMAKAKATLAEAEGVARELERDRVLPPGFADMWLMAPRADLTLITSKMNEGQV